MTREELLRRLDSVVVAMGFVCGRCEVVDGVVWLSFGRETIDGTIKYWRRHPVGLPKEGFRWLSRRVSEIAEEY